MTTRTLCGILLLLLLCLLRVNSAARADTLSPAAPGAAGTLTRVSRPEHGIPLGEFFTFDTLDINFPCGALSDDGLRVAYCAPPRVHGYDDGSHAPIFVLDRARGIVHPLPPLEPSPVAAKAVLRMSMSATGRWLAFTETRIAPLNGFEYKVYSAAYLYDTAEDTLRQIAATYDPSVDSRTFPFVYIGTLDIAADGGYVAFAALNFAAAPGEENDSLDIVRYEHATGQLRLISGGMNGARANGYNAQPSLSADGAVIAFTSAASNLTADDSYGLCPANNGEPNCPDVFVWDGREGGALALISRANNGDQANFGSGSPAITDDGQQVAFISAAFNLAPTDHNNRGECGGANFIDRCNDIYLYARATDQLRHVSRHPDTGAQGGSYRTVRLSDDGRTIAAETHGNILPGIVEPYNCDRAGCRYTIETIRFDTLTGSVTPLMPLRDGTSAFGDNFLRTLSGNGEWVLFATTTPEFWGGDRYGLPYGVDEWSELSDLDLGLLYTPTGEYRRITVRPSGSAAGDSRAPAFNPDGQSLIFSTLATHISDLSGPIIEVERASGDTRALNMAWASGHVRFNAGGTGIAFHRKTETQPATAYGFPFDSGSYSVGIGDWNPDISPDARAIVYETRDSEVEADSNSHTDIYTITGTINPTLISHNAQGVAGNGASVEPAYRPDGGALVYASRATDIVPTDSNGYFDLYEYDLDSQQTRLLTRAVNGAAANGDSREPRFALQGGFLVFKSAASNLVLSDTNGHTDIFVMDMQDESVELLSQGLDGAPANGDSWNPVITPDGRFVAFVSEASNLAANDPNGAQADIFMVDRRSGETMILSVMPDGTLLHPDLEDFDIAPDGRAFAFSTEIPLDDSSTPACDLHTDAPRQCEEVYLWNFDAIAPTQRVHMPLIRR